MENEIKRLEDNLDKANREWSDNIYKNSELNQQLRAVVASLDDIVFLINQECRFLDVWTNDESNLLHPKKDFLGKTIYEIYEENFAEIFHKAVEKVLATRKITVIEYLHPINNEWYSSKLSYIGEKGDDQLISMMVQNINEKKEAELKLKHSEQLLKEAQKLAHFGSWELDVIHNRLFWSEETHKIHEVDKGYEPDVESAINFYDDTSRDIIQKALDACIHDGISFDHELKIVTDKNNIKHVRAIGKAHYDINKKVNRVSGVFQDITLEHQREEELKQRDAEKNLILDNTQTLMCTHDIHGNLLSVNKAGVSMTGYESNEIIGRNLKDILSADVKPMFDDYLNILLNEGFASGTMKIITKAGSERIWAYKNVLYTDEFGKSFVIGSSIDVTNRAKAEQELLEAKEKAEKASMAKAEFLSTMSHEIRTPMNAVIGVTHLLLDDDPKPNQIDNLQTLKFSAENLLSLINDILDFSKIESGKIEFDSTEFHIDELINSIRQSHKLEATEKNISLKYSKDDELPNVLIGDPTRLFQILNNLVSNAIKFTEEGSVKLDVEVMEKKPESVRLLFTVEDTGIGIAKENLSRIFENFSQEQSDTTRKYGGSGLGLTIIKNLLELQGSDIHVESKKGEGSKFSFELDFSIGNTQQKETSFGTHSPIDKKNTLTDVNILLVEDQEFNIKVALEFLNKWGANVTSAINGTRAIEFVESNEYDVILMDLQMPEMDGFETTKIIRIHDKLTPIIALTASALTNIKEKVIDIGMNDFIAKPFNPNELHQKIINQLNIINKNPVSD